MNTDDKGPVNPERDGGHDLIRKASDKGQQSECLNFKLTCLGLSCGADPVLKVRLTPTLGSSRWLKQLGPCHPCGRPKLSSWLPAVAQPHLTQLCQVSVESTSREQGVFSLYLSTK